MSNTIQIAAMSLIWNNPEDFDLWLKEVKEAGYDGVSGFAHGSFKPYIERPHEFKKLLNRYGLKLASIDVTFQPTLDYYKKVCEFLQINQCENLVYIDPKGEKHFKKICEWLNQIGELSLTYGVRTLYHNHSNGIGRQFYELERLHSEVDPNKVYKMLDLGHATKDFTDLPVRERAIHFLRKHWGEIVFMEFKDWNEQTDLNTPLGEGYCDYDSVFQLIREQGYEGWILVEQNGNDGLSLGRTPLECATISRNFIRNGLGI